MLNVNVVKIAIVIVIAVKENIMIKLKKLLKEGKNAWDRKFGEPLPTLEDTTRKHEENLQETDLSKVKIPTMADYKKLKEDQGDIQTAVKINLRVNLDATIEGNEEDALKFKKDVEEKIQSVIDDYKAEATWRLD